MVTRGPNGEAPNLRLRPLFDRVLCVRVHAYLALGTRTELHWQVEAVTYLTGFDVEGPGDLIIRQIYYCLQELLPEGGLYSAALLGVLDLGPIVVQPGQVIRVQLERPPA